MHNLFYFNLLIERRQTLVLGRLSCGQNRPVFSEKPSNPAAHARLKAESLCAYRANPASRRWLVKTKTVNPVNQKAGAVLVTVFTKRRRSTASLKMYSSDHPIHHMITNS